MVVIRKDSYMMSREMIKVNKNLQQSPYQVTTLKFIKKINHHLPELKPHNQLHCKLLKLDKHITELKAKYLH
jgi:hypothetical protein